MFPPAGCCCIGGGLWVAPALLAPYLRDMDDTPAFLDTDRPDVPDLVVARGVLPFRLAELGVRGRLIRLGPLADALLGRHENPEAVNILTGKALALTAGLATALKFRGSFSLQAKGDGPVSLLLADCTEHGALRGYARADGQGVVEGASDGALLGEGYLAFTVDQAPEGERHQGIVAIEGESLAEMAEHYFQTSEQMNSFVRLACAHTPDGWRASALIIERVAAGGGIEEERAWDEDIDEGDHLEGFRTAAILAGTVSEAELLDDALTPEALLLRLFGTGEIRVDLARALAYGCRCSRARLAGILDTFAADDLDHMAADEAIVMTCEFCNLDFRFDRSAVRGTS
jgi:molecular chaperone Hsp33